MNWPVTIHLFAAVPALALGLLTLVLTKGHKPPQGAGSGLGSADGDYGGVVAMDSEPESGALLMDPSSCHLDHFCSGDGDQSDPLATEPTKSHGMDGRHLCGLVDYGRPIFPPGSFVVAGLFRLKPPETEADA